MHTALLDELPEKVAFREVGSRGTYQNPSNNGLKFGPRFGKVFWSLLEGFGYQ